MFKYTYHCDCTKLCSGSGRSSDSIFSIKKKKEKKEIHGAKITVLGIGKFTEFDS